MSKLLLASLLVVVCAFVNPVQESEFLIQPGIRVGKITARIDEDKLIKAYGTENITRDEFEYKGVKRVATILYPHTNNEAIILWQDEQFLAKPDVVILRRMKSQWGVTKGITVGTTLYELDKMNDKPIDFHGFGWENGGTIASWNGGSLNVLNLNKGVTFKLYYSKEKYQEKFEGFNNNRVYSSANPVLRDLTDKLFIGEIIIQFPRPKQ